jgi:hypothetical protein
MTCPVLSESMRRSSLLAFVSPSIVERATKGKLAALRAGSEYKWSGIVARESVVDHEVVEKGLRPTN